MPPKSVCPVCEKEFDGVPGRVTIVWLKITDEHGFDIIKMIRTCSWACKTKYEERILQEFQESERFGIRK